MRVEYPFDVIAHGQCVIRTPRIDEPPSAADEDLIHVVAFFFTSAIRFRERDAIVAALHFQHEISGIAPRLYGDQRDSLVLDELEREMERAIRSRWLVVEQVEPVVAPRQKMQPSAPSPSPAAPVAPPPAWETETPTGTHWIALRLTTEDGVPCKDAECFVIDGGGTTRRGRLNAEGECEFSDLPPGPCDVDFPEYCPTLWLPGAQPGASVQAHVVRQGEHVGSIAERYRLGSIQCIWDHSDNVALKERRTSPCVLTPGDVVRVPSRAQVTQQFAADQMHEFALCRELLELKIKLLGIDHSPLASQPVEVATSLQSNTHTTTGVGEFTEPITNGTKRATVTVGTRRLLLDVGHLDPVTEPSGVKARLSNLGYPAGAADVEDLDALRFSTQLFQNDVGLPVTGEVDEATRSSRPAPQRCSGSWELPLIRRSASLAPLLPEPSLPLDPRSTWR